MYKNYNKETKQNNNNKLNNPEVFNFNFEWYNSKLKENYSKQ